MDWLLMLNNGRIVIFKLTRFPDRIIFQSGINIATEHQQMIAGKPQMRNEILLQTPSLIVQLDHQPTITQVNNTISVITITKTHFHTTISKADFLTKSIKLRNVQQVVRNQLSVPLQTSLAQLQQTPTQPDASAVGIG